MENDKTNINKELNHIKNSINKKNETHKNDDDFYLLNNIISKSKKPDLQIKNKDMAEKNNNFIQNEIIKKPNNPKKNFNNKASNSGKPPKDPVAAMVDREIKPIIKKWIGKNLKSFVKSIVIKEMKLISKVTQKHK